MTIMELQRQNAAVRSVVTDVTDITKQFKSLELMGYPIHHLVGVIDALDRDVMHLNHHLPRSDRRLFGWYHQRCVRYHLAMAEFHITEFNRHRAMMAA